MAADETVLGGSRFTTDIAGYRAVLAFAKRFKHRTWAIEGCSGIAHHIAVRLLADGETVVDVPPKLSARAGVLATGQRRKIDATDAHPIALVGTRRPGYAPSLMTSSSPCCGCWSTVAAPSARTTPA